MSEDWTVANPIDHTQVGDLPARIRNVKTLVVSGMHRFFWQATAPTARYDTTAFDSDDLGSIWIDSDDNKISILTATTPTWTEISVELFAAFLAAAREIAFADATLTLKNTDAEDTDGGRQSRWIVKGVQSGDEETTLGYIEISHEGAGDDQKGQWKLVVNDGDDGDAPSKVAIVGKSTGKIDASESTAILDEDNMASDDADCLATQQSIKAYVDSITDPAYSGGESHTFEGGLIFKHGSSAIGDATSVTITFGTAFPTGIVSASMTPGKNADNAIGDECYLKSKSTTTLVVRNNNGNGVVDFFEWQAWGY